MGRLGFRCGKDALARMLREDGYSLQGMSRVLEGKQHPDRDAQFRHINAMIAEFTAAGDPAVSVDAKKKEQLGPYHRAGRSWRPAGDPVRVRDHDFPDAELGKITPYGVYDIAANTGFVSVGTSCDTAAFAVNALAAGGWAREGSSRYPGAGRLLVVLRRRRLQQLHGPARGKTSSPSWRRRPGLEITVCHFPPGTSKWNKIEHRLFCHITRTWRGPAPDDARRRRRRHRRDHHRPGPEVHRRPRRRPTTPAGSRSAIARMKHLEERVLDRARVPRRVELRRPARPRPEPDPEPDPRPPAPDPALRNALAALAGIDRPRAPCWRPSPCPGPAAREQRLHLDPRRTPAARPAAARPWKLPARRPSSPPPPATTGSACTYRLLGELLGAHESTISLAARRITPLLAQHGITPRRRARQKTAPTATRPKPPT